METYPKNHLPLEPALTGWQPRTLSPAHRSPSPATVRPLGLFGFTLQPTVVWVLSPSGYRPCLHCAFSLSCELRPPGGKLALPTTSPSCCLHPRPGCKGSALSEENEWPGCRGLSGHLTRPLISLTTPKGGQCSQSLGRRRLYSAWGLLPAVNGTKPGSPFLFSELCDLLPHKCRWHTPSRPPDSDRLLQRVPASLPLDSVSEGDRWGALQGQDPHPCRHLCSMPTRPIQAIYFAVSRATKPKTAPVPET